MIRDKIKQIIPTLSFNFPYSTDEWSQSLLIENYHSHTGFSNTTIMDSPVSVQDYVNRIHELGGKCLFSGEHGSQGNHIEVYDIASKSDLKYVHSTEAYWVKDRREQDNTNCHICIIALNAEARQELNYILSVANEDGYYYRPRLDLELILGLNPHDFIVTSACFTKGNQVLTKNGYKNIEEIKIGDEVKNRYGEWEKVNYPTKIHYKGKGFACTTNDYFDNQIVCTKDHKFLVTTLNDLYYGKDFEWIDMDSISKSYSHGNKSQKILLRPILIDYSMENSLYKKNWKDSFIKESNHYWSRKIFLPEHIVITPELMRLFGFFIGDGHITLKKNKTIRFTVNSTEFDYYYQDFFHPVEQQLGIKFSYKTREANHRVDITSGSIDVINLFYYLFGDCKSYNKQIPKQLMHISKELDSELLLGMLLSDGNFRNTKKNKYDSGRITYATTSEVLCKQILELGESLGIKFTYSSKDEYIDKKNVHHRKSYRLESSSNGWYGFTKKQNIRPYDFLNIINNLYQNTRIKPFIIKDGTTYKKILIKSTREIQLDEEVYCLNNNTHSFVINGVIAHNCIAGWSYEDADEIWLKIAQHFGKNFFFEVQNHNTAKQKELNQHILSLAKEHSIDIMCGLDSHYIYEEESIKRDCIVKFKKSENEDELGWYMDYPSGKETYHRFVEQGILTEEQILRAMMNTNVFTVKCKEIVLNKHFKIPIYYKGTTYDERVKIFKSLLNERYQEEKLKSQDKIKGIQYEAEQVIDSHVVDYFLTNYHIVKDAIENEGGVLTPTSRGSAASFIINKLLGFTTMDRYNSEIPIYPERFLTKERVQAGQMPDIDLNIAKQEPFVQATRKILGEHGCYPLMAVGYMKEKAAWQLYSKVNGTDPQTANDISKYIDKYNDALKYAEDDEKDFIKVEDYIPSEYVDLYNESKEYQSIIDGLKCHACGHLIFDGDIRREIGLISAVSKASGKRTLVACVEGKYLDDYGYVKDDFLIVDSVALMNECFEAIGEKVPSFDELREMVRDDELTWNIYENGITCCVNQIEKDSTAQKAMVYKPKNLAELAAFIAGIRPGFASLLPTFLRRESYSTGEPRIDELLEDSYHFMLYQESIMKVLSFLDLPMGDTYGVIKSISKKKLKGEKKENLKKQLIQAWKEHFGNTDKFDEVWNVIEDSARYSFNSPHALAMAGDSAYLAWFKAHHTSTFYEVAINHYLDKDNKKKMNALTDEAKEKYGYKIATYQYGNDNTKTNVSDEKKLIYPSMSLIKGMQSSAPYTLLKIKEQNPKDAVELMKVIGETKTMSTKKEEKLNDSSLTKLIRIGYFTQFGSINELLIAKEIYNTYGTKKTLKKPCDFDVSGCFGKETAKQYSQLDNLALCRKIFAQHTIPPDSEYALIQNQIEIMGYTMLAVPNAPMNYFALQSIEVNKYGTPFVKLYRLYDGGVVECKMDKKYFEEHPFNKDNNSKFIAGQIMKCAFKSKEKRKKVNGNWVLSGEFEYVLSAYVDVEEE